MKIDQIIPDFSKMTTEEIEGVIRGVRRSRTTVKQVSNVKRPTKVAEKSKTDVSAAIKKMSPEQLELLKKLLS